MINLKKKDTQNSSFENIFDTYYGMFREKVNFIYELTYFIYIH